MQLALDNAVNKRVSVGHKPETVVQTETQFCINIGMQKLILNIDIYVTKIGIEVTREIKK